jgi:putative ABC transport system permease protein
MPDRAATSVFARVFRRLRVMLAPVFHRDALDRDMDDEFALHIELRADDLARHGLTRDEAMRRARIEFGNVAAAKEAARRSWGTEWLDHLRQDLRYTLRTLRRNPMFACVAVLSLGFGAGATTTMFSVIDALDFRGLPYRDAGHLAWLSEVSPPDFEMCSRCAFPTAASTASDWIAQTHSFAALGAVGSGSLSWEHDDVSEELSGLEVTPGFFSLLGVSPVLGREFAASDTIDSAEPVLMLSYRTWQTRFGGDRQVIGRQIESRVGPGVAPALRRATIIGVLPERFHFQDERDVWLPLRLDAHAARTSRYITVVGRLRDGASIASADAELQTIAFRAAATDPKSFRGWGARVSPLRSLLIESAGRGRFVLFGVTLLVLGIAVLNVAGLLLARAVARQHELAMRTALGASRSRLVWQLLVEGLTVGAAGAVIGVLLAAWGVRLVPRWLSTESTGLAVRLDWQLLLFASVVALGAGLAAAVLPALRTGSERLSETLHGRSSHVAGYRAASSGVLVTLQVALVLVLLSAGVLLSRDFLEVRYLDLGYAPQGLHYTYLFGSRGRSADLSTWSTTAEAARERVAALRGVESASLEHQSAMHPQIVRPLAGTNSESSNPPVVKAVTAGYFATFGTPILLGRRFGVADRAGAPLVAILNKAAADAFWPGANPLGKRILLGDSASAGEVLTVVGVAANLERGELVERHWPAVYRPLAQGKIYGPTAALYVRLVNDDPAVLSAAESAIRQTLGRRAVPFESNEQSLDTRLFDHRWNAIALDLFAGFGLLLAAMGIYGMVAYAATQRTREIGVRIALGAKRGDIVALLAGRGARLAFVGVIAGSLGAYGATRVLRSFVMATSVTNPWLLAGSALLMLGVAIAATLIPAYRGTRVDATIALRAE